MTHQAKYIQIADLLEQRIEKGYYRLGNIPGALKLANELGASYLTVRQAIQLLLKRGILIRSESDRLQISPDNPVEHSTLKVLFLRPAYLSTPNKWIEAISHTARKYHCHLQEIVFTSCIDPVILESLDGDFDLIFCMHMSREKLLISKLERHKNKIVTLFSDLTEYGIRLLDGPSPERIKELIGMLAKQGVHSIDYFGKEPENNRQEGVRQQMWQEAIAQYNCQGTAHLFREHSLTISMQAFSRQMFAEVLERERFHADALFCANVDEAMGAIRALLDCGIRVPEDVKVVSFGEPERATLFCPSITVVNIPDINPALDPIFEHYLGKKQSPKRLVFRAEDPDKVIFYGESTR
ncbi:MAG: substrate-binding domain-containing protein [Victivallaceae bacterium]|nr:substrate-binding domain-containing protein [Victivallaceae bacterium]